ncbi:MAG: peptide chain release factor N(5)-glutamine methyltransferase [Chloroflexi bacterium]|nr:peptide chain release factor N(5)-glutamine methyltransferase [Chloroflexota bacterium]
MEEPLISFGGGIRWAADELTRCGVEDPILDAELLLAATSGMTRSQLHLHWNDALPADIRQKFAALVQRRCRREPLAYILGRRAFYDIELEVNPAVLIPRPETELLVEQALAWLTDRTACAVWAADIGTGSGAIAITLAHRFTNLHVWAADRSLAALALARRNVQRYHLEERVNLACSDLLSATTAHFDLVMANLPYLPSERLVDLQPEVAQYEPRLALDGGELGIDVIARLCVLLPSHLNPSALVLLEIDEGQGSRVSQMLGAALPDASVSVLPDYAGLERIVRAELIP